MTVILSLLTFIISSNVLGSFCTDKLENLQGNSPQKERRFNFEGRDDIDQINEDLGRMRKEKLLETYNPGNRYELNRMDETYFVGLADILEYRYIQDFPELSDELVRRKVGRDLDELMQGCKGS